MIETRYHIETYFEYPQNVLDAEGYNIQQETCDGIDDALLALGLAPDVEDLTVNSGGPAHGPYLTCWSRYRISAVTAERDLETLLRERGCTITEDWNA